MLFTERHHAYISALFYKTLKEANFKNYESTFLFATQKAAEQRGARMALRAIRDGVEKLDYAAYRYYGEWVFTDDYLRTIEGKTHIEPIESANDFAYAVHHCPWADVYRELGLESDGGVLYCSDLDASIIRGFNPELKFALTQTLQESDKCVQYQIDGNVDNCNSFNDKKLENIKDFGYQCGHVYKVFSKVMLSVYKSEGASINAKVIEDFKRVFGLDMANKLIEYLETDFCVI